MTCLAFNCILPYLLCHTFPWIAESGQWFPGRRPESAPLLCSYSCSHSERTLLLAPHLSSQRWPEPSWSPQAASAGPQLRRWQTQDQLTLTYHISAVIDEPCPGCAVCLPLPLPQSSLSQTCHSRPSLRGLFLSSSRAWGWSSKIWKRSSLSERSAQRSTCQHAHTGIRFECECEMSKIIGIRNILFIPMEQVDILKVAPF